MIQLQPNEGLRIRNWTAVYEKSDAKKLKVLTWISIPTGNESTGLHNLFDDFGPERAVMFLGLWELLCKVAAKSPVRGALFGSRTAYATSALARQCMGVPEHLIDELLEWAVGPRARWLEVVKIHDDTVEVVPVADVTNTSEDLRDSPDYRTRQDRTRQDISGRPVATAGNEFSDPVMEEYLEVGRRLVRVRKCHVTEKVRAAFWRLACWLDGRDDRHRMLDELVALVASERPQKLDRYVGVWCCRRSQLERDEFWRSWDGILPPKAKSRAG